MDARRTPPIPPGWDGIDDRFGMMQTGAAVSFLTRRFGSPEPTEEGPETQMACDMTGKSAAIPSTAGAFLCNSRHGMGPHSFGDCTSTYGYAGLRMFLV